MNKRTITTTEYALNEEEHKVVIQALGYCLHRMLKHNKKIGATVEVVDNLREELLEV